MSETGVKDDTETSAREPASSATDEHLASRTPGESSDEAQQNPPRPIITYPEFLSQREGQVRPPALITTQRLLNTLYVSLSAYAVLYAGTEYLIKPMIEQLTEARHELHRHADDKLQRLNSKLEDVMSNLHPELSKEEMHCADADANNDVTACFHQNAATQTSSSLENLPSIASSSESDKGASPGSTSRHVTKLRNLRSHLDSLLPSSSVPESSSSVRSTLENPADVSASLRELHQSLESLPFTGTNAAYAPNRQEADAHSKLKSEIRAMKGTLLSAKNFPSGVKGVVGAS